MLRSISFCTIVLTLMLAAIALTGCETAPRTAQDREQLQREAEAAIRSFTQADPTMQEFFDSSHG